MNAFPETRTEWNPDRDAREVTSAPGMTLRDYFAAKAMQAMAAGTWPDTNERPEIATRAYLLADMMMKVRAQ